MGLLLLLGSAVLTFFTVGPHYSAGQGTGVLMSLTALDQKEILDKHNNLRKGVQPTASRMKKLYWNNDAAANAAKWAKQCSWDHSPQEQRTLSTCRCGENIFKGNYRYTLSFAIQYWYDEKQYYAYGTGPTTKDQQYKHFTQVVWDTTSYIGCALAQCAADYFLVCQYCSAGNIQSLLDIGRPYATGPSCDKCSGYCENQLCTNPCIYEDLNPACESYKQSCSTQPDVQSKCQATCRCA